MSPILGAILLLNLVVFLFFCHSAGKEEDSEGAALTAFVTIACFVIVGAIDVISLIIWAIAKIFRLH